MRYLPHTEEEIKTMMARIGVADFSELFPTVSGDCRYEGEMNLPKSHSEWELEAHMHGLGAMTEIGPEYAVLLGAGCYHHNIPAIISALAGRSEFLTAYTPYQPEMAQGTLQGVFEYQTLTARLLGTDIANASMYDGASALAEALLMALRLRKKKRRVAVSAAVHPHYRAVVDAYFRPTEFEVVVLPYGEDGRTDLTAIDQGEYAAIALQSPNFFGVIEELERAATAIHAGDGLFVACFTEPLSFGLLKNPGSLGADIVCGEGQSLGISRSFGGPGLGMFGCRQEFVRSMPGRLVGETVDLDGKRGFVLTLSTREQHIRREKATSNICSNQGINTITAAMYMAALGGSGMRRLARLNYDKAEYMKNALIDAGARLLFAAPTFNEFVFEFPGDFNITYRNLLEKKIVAGLDLGRYYPELSGKFLLCVTETTSKEVIDRVAEEVRS